MDEKNNKINNKTALERDRLWEKLDRSHQLETDTEKTRKEGGENETRHVVQNARRKKLSKKQMQDEN